VAKRIGDVGPTTLPEQIQNCVAQRPQGMCGVSYMDLGDFHIMPLRGTTKHANLDDLLGSDPSGLYFVYGT
jgi:hypothetical protein